MEDKNKSMCYKFIDGTTINSNGKIVKNEGSLIEITDEGLNINCNDFEIIHREKKNNKLIDFLNYEESQLIKRIQKAREDENFGTYKNLIQALVNVSELLDKKDWKMSYSEYTTDNKKQVAIWEQNGEGNIRNHKVWNVDEDKKVDEKTRIMGLDCSIGSYDTAKLSICIVEEGKNSNNLIYTKRVGFDRVNKNTIKVISDICDIFDVDKIIVDKNAYGLMLYEHLIESNLFKKDEVVNVKCFDPEYTNCLNKFEKTLNNKDCFVELSNQLNNLNAKTKHGVIKYEFKDTKLDMGLVYALMNIAIYMYREK